ncbi:ATP-binding cassette domain-containing protein [Amycolatopsis sp. cg13]|uniref:ATP-binding cassette domain-containing protein n=1 Tax=Amycolatopsis sp. cg13 TaxID=3238807 RepID=UPI003526587E
MPGLAIQAEGLVKSFGETRALRGLDLEVPEGTIFGLLGPNGSGKTTAVRVFSTLLRPDAGVAKVAGRDVVRDGAGVRKLISLTGQNAAVDERIPGRSNLIMFGRLRNLSASRAKARADELLERFSLQEAGGRLVKTYSGGMRRRLDLAVSLIVTPAVMYLDEPTTGLDPVSRSQLWDDIRQLTESGTTVLLTTQYLDEADQLADRIAVLKEGRVVSEGTPAELKRETGPSRLDVVVSDKSYLSAAETALRSMSADDEVAVDPGTLTLTTVAGAGFTTLAAAVRALESAKVDVVDLSLRPPTLDEVFLHLVHPDQPSETEAA